MGTCPLTIFVQCPPTIVFKNYSDKLFLYVAVNVHLHALCYQE